MTQNLSTAFTQFVQQGTGVGQASNLVKLGWNGGSFLKATIDSLDLGKVWTDYGTSTLFNGAFFNGAGYVKLPNGLLLQWQFVNAAADGTYNFPTTFPNSCVFIHPELTGSDGGNFLFATVQNVTTSQFVMHSRVMTPTTGLNPSGVNNVGYSVFSLGY